MRKSASYRFICTLVVSASALFSLGAKGSGCSGEIANDGTAGAWPVGPAPVHRTTAPMSCEFLRGDNCWKRLVAKAEACAAGAHAAPPATFDAARKTCTSASGARVEFGGPLSTPADGSVSILATDWRVLDANGTPCVTGKIVGVGHALLDVQGEVAELESTSLFGYRVTCPDGATYMNEDAPGDSGAAATADGGASPSALCASFGTEYLAHRAPGVLASCDGSTKQCKVDLWGGANGETRVAACGW